MREEKSGQSEDAIRAQQSKSNTKAVFAHLLNHDYRAAYNFLLDKLRHNEINLRETCQCLLDGETLKLALLEYTAYYGLFDLVNLMLFYLVNIHRRSHQLEHDNFCLPNDNLMHISELGQALYVVKGGGVYRPKVKTNCFSQRTPLTWACQGVLRAIENNQSIENNLAIIRLLVQQGASITDGLIPLRYNDGVLIRAKWDTVAEPIAAAILDGLKGHKVIKESELYALLLWVCYHNCYIALERLLTTYQLAIDYVYYFRIFKIERGTPIYIKVHQMTCLHVAIFYGHVCIAELLTRKGANVNKLIWCQFNSSPQSYQSNGTFLHTAIALKHTKIVDRLISLGADMRAIIILQDKDENFINSFCPLAFLYYLYSRAVPQPMVNALVMAGAQIPLPYGVNYSDHYDAFLKDTTETQHLALHDRIHNNRILHKKLSSIFNTVLPAFIPEDAIEVIASSLIAFMLPGDDAEDKKRLAGWYYCQSPTDKNKIQLDNIYKLAWLDGLDEPIMLTDEYDRGTHTTLLHLVAETARCSALVYVINTLVYVINRKNELQTLAIDYGCQDSWERTPFDYGLVTLQRLGKANVNKRDVYWEMRVTNVLDYLSFLVDQGVLFAFPSEDVARNTFTDVDITSAFLMLVKKILDKQASELTVETKQALFNWGYSDQVPPDAITTPVWQVLEPCLVRDQYAALLAGHANNRADIVNLIISFIWRERD